MNELRKEIITWQEVSKLVSLIIPQFEIVFDVILMVSPSGVIPAGILAAGAGITDLQLAQVEFPPGSEFEPSKLITWPTFLQFPADDLVLDKNVLVVNNAWGSGRTTWAVNQQVEHAGGMACTCVLHYNPYRNLLKYHPDYFAAVTDAYIIYPWDLDPAGPDQVLLKNGGRG
jgi:hypoxanthine phosphoribosyltransferase